jgi:hypothetical protein
MAPRDPSLPEGTDHIIDTNIDLGDTGGGSGGGGAGGLGGGSGGAGGLGGGAGATGGTTGLGGGSGAAGGASTTGGTGTGGTGGGSAFQFDKSGGGSGSGGSSGGNRSSGIAGQVREQISTLKSQAGDRARSFADDGKSQATSFLQTVAQIVADAAGSVEERLGSQYSGIGPSRLDLDQLACLHAGRAQRRRSARRRRNPSSAQPRAGDRRSGADRLCGGARAAQRHFRIWQYGR